MSKKSRFNKRGRKKKKTKPIHAIIIPHGKSELLLSRYITTNLRLPVKDESKKNGNQGIQINDLELLMSKTPFKDKKTLLQKYENIEFNSKFKIFIMMDTDDCDPIVCKEFKTGTMFKRHQLSEYIVPIYSIQNLEDLLHDIGLINKNDPDFKKANYDEIFPIKRENKGGLYPNNYNSMEQLYNQFKDSNKGNWDVFIKYCLDRAKDNKLK